MTVLGSRRLGRLWFGAALVAAAAPAPALTQDYNATPNYGVVTLRGGFPPDPHRVSLQSGGNVDASARIDRRCLGFISNAPDLRVNYTAGSGPLVISVSASADTTLVVNAPDGRWHCNDDGPQTGTNPLLRFDRPASGRYEIWVGTYGSTALNPARLEIGSGQADAGGWTLSEYRWTNATDMPSAYSLRNGTGPGSFHYLRNGREAGSFFHFFNGRSPGSFYYFRNGTDMGSDYYWRNGQGPGSRYYWTYGTGCLSEQMWRYGTSGEAAGGCAAGAPVVETLLVLCLTGRLDIAPCHDIDAMIREDEARHPPTVPENSYGRRLREIRDSVAR